MKANLKPGNPFPDFELPDHDGVNAKLSGLMAGKPAVLTFNRGNY